MDVSIRINDLELFDTYITKSEGCLWERQDRFRERIAMATQLQFAGKLVTFQIKKHKRPQVEKGVVLKLETVWGFKKETSEAIASYQGRFIVQTKKGVTLVEGRLFKYVHGDISYFRNKKPRGFPYDDWFFNTYFDIDTSNHDGLLNVV